MNQGRCSTKQDIFRFWIIGDSIRTFLILFGHEVKHNLVSMRNLKFQSYMETNFAVLASAKQLRMECFYVVVGSTTNWKQWVFSSINGTEIVCLTTHSMYLGYPVLSVLVSFFVALGPVKAELARLEGGRWLFSFFFAQCTKCLDSAAESYCE